MNPDGSRRIGWRGDPNSRADQETVERTVQENAERFAQALLPYVVPQPPQVIGLPEGWRGGDGVLTPTSGRQQGSLGSAASGGPAATAAQANDQANDRVLIQVHSPDLGELSVVLDRSSTGVRVMIGVADARTAELMAPEREALLARLVGNGVRVHSLQIVGQGEFGTLLAVPRRMASPRAFDPRSPAESDERTNQRRGSRKLNVIG